MIRVYLYNPDTAEMTHGGTELIATWKASDNNLIWVDIEGEQSASEEELLSGFGIHPLAIQDALRLRHPPEIERFSNFLFILLRGLDADTSSIDFGLIQLSHFVGDRFLLTRQAHVDVVGLAVGLGGGVGVDELQRDASIMKEGPGSLAIRLGNRLARRYIEILLELEPRLGEIEEQMFRQADDTLLSELTGYKSQLSKLMRIANYHEQIAMKLKASDDQLFPFYRALPA